MKAAGVHFPFACVANKRRKIALSPYSYLARRNYENGFAQQCRLFTTAAIGITNPAGNTWSSVDSLVADGEAGIGSQRDLDLLNHYHVVASQRLGRLRYRNYGTK
jgi:hypothetical protein